MVLGSAALKLFSTTLYILEFCCAGIVVAIYGYFLSVLADRNETITRWEEATIGIAGGIVLYTVFAILLTCFLGGKTFFAFLGILFNLICCAGMVAIAILTRDGADKCSGNVNTPLGNGPANSKEGFHSDNQDRRITYSVSLGTACRLNSACFAVAILGAFLFLFSAIVQLFLGRNHKKEKRFGPSPRNGYTKGSGVKFWQRNRRSTGLRDPEVAATGGLAPGHPDYRPSHDTAYTGSTVAAPGGVHDPHKPMTGGFHTAPTGTYHNNAAANY